MPENPMMDKINDNEMKSSSWCALNIAPKILLPKHNRYLIVL